MTTTPTATVTIEELAAEAKSQFAEILELDAKKAAIDALYEKTKAAKVIALGTTLSKIKAALPYGGWYPWLAAAGYKPSTAQNYINVARLYSSNPQSIGDFGYTQLTLLIPLADELPAFLAAMTANGTNPAGLTIRDLREAVKNWRQNHSLPATETVTIDAPAVTLTFDEPTATAATVFSITPATTSPTFVPAPPVPTKYEQLSLFDLPALPALPPTYQLPSLIVEAAAKINTPIYLIERHDVRAEIIPPVILVITSPLARWVNSLRTKAAATITTRLPMIRAGLVRERAVLIFYLGDDVPAFAATFKIFGKVYAPYKPKSSAASNSEALW